MSFSIDFSIDNWFYWGNDYCDISTAPHYIDKDYDLTDVPLLQRRRLPEVARRIHSFTKELADQKTPIIYASHNGEIAQTFAIIRSLDGEVSPAKFSLSVHNAVAGLLSIIHSNTQGYQAIDSLSGLIETAITEAMGLLVMYEHVGVVYYDESLPEEFLSMGDDCKSPSLRAFGMIVSKGDNYTLKKTPTINGHQRYDVKEELEKITDIVKFLSSDEASITTSYAYSSWAWGRHVS